ncbi:MAG: glutaredoxin 3 [Reyranellaceae bacterium]
MAKVEMYTTQWCGYCARARALLERKGVEFTEYDVEEEAGKREEARARSGGRTSVPQIFIGGRHIGGSDEMAALEAAGKLDGLLAASG